MPNLCIENSKSFIMLLAFLTQLQKCKILRLSGGMNPPLTPPKRGINLSSTQIGESPLSGRDLGVGKSVGQPFRVTIPAHIFRRGGKTEALPYIL
ncbi:MAG: hypothetical protein DWB56_08115 [Candidatus Jettenia sp.]|nr:MAG: hypothetical protein EDM77_03305 [Candidatus Jettenia sp. AMX1]MBC6928910.1 hypothetical protein [Candidatus Jettenia sp.]MCE7879911.1 hypothetical protein [Candidatus Jettenia sp. AMX1]MCQ3926691.1 hypothetical protein [Candidatus Jettenia sp.]